MPGHASSFAELEAYEQGRARATRWLLAALGLCAGQLMLWLTLWRVIGDAGVAVMAVIAAAQAVSGVLAVIAGVQLRRADRGDLARGLALGAVLVGAVVGLAAPAIWIGGSLNVSLRGLDELDIPSLASP